jgi:hypothetical protein
LDDYKPIYGKTYSLFGQDTRTEPFYRRIPALNPGNPGPGIYPIAQQKQKETEDSRQEISGVFSTDGSDAHYGW